MVGESGMGERALRDTGALLRALLHRQLLSADVPRVQWPQSDAGSITRERASPLLKACDEALRLSVQELDPTWVIGVGRFAEASARRALEGLDVRVAGILHPSPASPAANRDWQGQARAQLAALGIES